MRQRSSNNNKKKVLRELHLHKRLQHKVNSVVNGMAFNFRNWIGAMLILQIKLQKLVYFVATAVLYRWSREKIKNSLELYILI